MFRSRNKRDKEHNHASGGGHQQLNAAAFEAGAPYSHLVAGRLPEKIASRSMMNLSAAPTPTTAAAASSSTTSSAAAAARPSTGTSDESPNFFFFDKVPVPGAAAQSSSYANSPISPLPPTLPPIPRVSSVRSVVGGEREEDNEDAGNASTVQTAGNSWLPSLEAIAGEERGWEDERQQAVGEIRHGPTIPMLARDGETTSRPHTSTAKETQMRPLTASSRQEQPRRPRTASRGAPEESNSNEMRHDASWQASRLGSEAPASPAASRPQTSESSGKSYAQPSEASSNGGSTSHEKASSIGQSIIMMGPTAQPSSLSPSNFPSESHRPPPRPPNSHSSPQIHAYIPVPKVMPLPIPKQKHKLNLRNPMSLLLKRRSGQNGQQPPEDSLMLPRIAGSYPTLINDADPSIRGKIVHDFSAPPDRRNQALSPNAYRGYSSPMTGSMLKESEEPRVEKQHTPVFREHFDDNKENNEAAIRAETLANRGFIARNLPPPMPSAPPPAPPPFGRPAGLWPSSPSPPPPEPPPKTGHTLQTLPVPIPVPLSPVEEDTPTLEESSKVPSGIQRRITAGSRKQNRPFSTASRMSRASRASRSSIASDASYSSSGLPTHMSSKASRFSFQLAGKDSMLQEKMLEERHKQKEAAKLAAEGNKEQEYEEIEEEDYDFDDMDDFEEDVPMVGDDWGYSGNSIGTMALGGLGNMTLDNLQNITVPNVGMFALNGNPVDMSSLTAQTPPITGLGITSGEENVLQIEESSANPTGYSFPGMPVNAAVPFDFNGETMDDDLYFDDGLIDEVNFDDTERFDESVLDDPSHPLYERKPRGPALSAETDAAMADDTDNEHVSKLVPKNSIHGLNGTSFNFQQHQNPDANPDALNEYHNILALAALKAAEAGRFDRKNSPDDMTTGRTNATSPQVDSQPSLIPDDSRTSQATTISPPGASTTDDSVGESVKRHESQKSVVFSLGGAYDNDFMAYASDLSDYDSAFEDDHIIAAANADALANDDDGIYGSEFGFYARPRSGSESEEDAVFSNGGYFGPKEWGEIQRQKSTREPNLTPITERSEYSTRNSLVSIPTLDKGATASPGLAQLARMSPSWDSEMTLENLSKLRRHAFGGSHTSLGSLGSARDSPSSPLASSPVIAKQEVSSTSRLSNEGRNNVSTHHTLPYAQKGHEGEDEEAWEDATATDDSDFTDTEEVEEDVESLSNTATTYSTADNNANTSRKFYSRPFKLITQSPPPAGYPNTLPSFQFPVLPPTQDTSSPTSPIPTSTSLHATNPQNLGLQPLSPPPTLGSTTSNNHKAASGTFYSPASSLASPSLVSPVKSLHSRSGSDSVTYVQETDAANGASHWVLERRRTGEDGVEQLVGRTKIEYGTI